MSTVSRLLPGLAVNRFANAGHYLASGEYGAARYELRLVERPL